MLYTAHLIFASQRWCIYLSSRAFLLPNLLICITCCENVEQYYMFSTPLFFYVSSTMQVLTLLKLHSQNRLSGFVWNNIACAYWIFIKFPLKEATIDHVIFILYSAVSLQYGIEDVVMTQSKLLWSRLFLINFPSFRF